MDSSLPTVAVAMSGGVDSSVAAALLVERGHRVFGLMLRLWSEPGREVDNRCCTPDAIAQARRVAAILGFPFYVVDSREVFKETVVKNFLEGYSSGITPNPCLVCNRLVRWGFLLDYARSMGAEAMATGHYARLRKVDNGQVQLLKGLDSTKDQAYVLSALTQAQLAQTILPVGEYGKPAVRAIARQLNLPVADRPDSQDLCFLGGDDYRIFLARYGTGPVVPGPILDRHGKVLGTHSGLMNYTIGQRKGLPVSSPVALYVLEKNNASNTLVVGPEEELGSWSLVADQVNWIGGQSPAQEFRAQVKIRYKASLVWGTVRLLPDGQVEVVFDQPLRDITPGQRVVFYDGELVLGGGTII